MAGARDPSGEPASLVLASGSPQRRAILQTLGVAFRVRVADVVEQTDGEPRAVATENAQRKAIAVARDEPAGTLVLGADTVIVADDLVSTGRLRAVGKPADAEAAAAMLRRWSGAAHRVASAVALVRASGGSPSSAPEVLLADVDTTLVRFKPLSEAEIDAYVATGEWAGRAGAYAIQGRGALLVDGIDGDWWTVVGLPVALLARRAPALFR